MRQFTCPKAVTHPSTNRARCRATALIETSALPLHQTANLTKGLIATECSYRGAGGSEVPQCGPGTKLRRWSRGRSPPEAEGCEVGRRCPLPTGESGRGLGRWLCPFPEFLKKIYLKMVSFGAFWVALYVIYILIYWILKETVVTIRLICERTTWCVCPSYQNNSSAAHSNSSSWTQKGFLDPVPYRPQTIVPAWERALPRKKTLFEAWEGQIAEMSGLGTALSCVPTNFNHALPGS